MFNVLKNRIFHAALIFAAAYPFMEALIFKIVYHFLGVDMPGEDIVAAYSSIASIAISAVIIFLLVNDFTDGAIRNKIINGVKRSHIVLSSVTIGALVSGLICMVACISQTIVICLFTTGYSSLLANEVSSYYIAQFAISVTVGAFMSALVMIFGGTKIAYFIGLVVAFLFKLASMEVGDKLYPESGICTLTGKKLMLYSGYDRFCPFAYFSGTLNHPLSDCLTGCLVLTVISILIALPVFIRKELK